MRNTNQNLIKLWNQPSTTVDKNDGTLSKIIPFLPSPRLNLDSSNYFTKNSKCWGWRAGQTRYKQNAETQQKRGNDEESEPIIGFCEPLVNEKA